MCRLLLLIAFTHMHSCRVMAKLPQKMIVGACGRLSVCMLVDKSRKSQHKVRTKFKGMCDCRSENVLLFVPRDALDCEESLVRQFA